VAICENGRTRRAGRIACDRQTLELFAGSVSADDQVAMEATSNALAIARILEGHVSSGWAKDASGSNAKSAGSAS
jgi:hypothetical protein